MKQSKYLILTIVLLLPLFLSSQSEDPYKPELAAYPQISYSDETGFIFGGITLYQFYSSDITDPFFRNKLQLQAVYSERKQFEVNFEPEFYRDKGRTRIAGQIKLRNWPSDYFGIGSQAFEDPQNYTHKSISFELEIDREIIPRIFLGLNLEYDSSQITDKSQNCSLVINQIPGSCDYDILGLGASLIRDKRDSRNYPTSGSYQKLNILHYDKKLGSDFQFSKAYLDLRYYFSLDPLNTIALQNLFELTRNQAPFLELAELGDQMRAFDSARFIDNHLFLARIEYRTFPLQFKLLDRLGFAAFAETGKVTNSYENLDLTDLKFCYGGGLRFSIFTDDRTNLRFDLGFSAGETGINIGFAEAF